MKRSPEDAWEGAMKIQEVILRAMPQKITGWQAAEIIGLSDRSIRHWRSRATRVPSSFWKSWRGGAFPLRALSPRLCTRSDNRWVVAVSGEVPPAIVQVDL